MVLLFLLWSNLKSLDHRSILEGSLMKIPNEVLRFLVARASSYLLQKSS